MSEKKALEVEVLFQRLREVVKPFPQAAMFELADAGYTSPFEQLVACIISIRTYDEVSLPAARRLFAHARTPAQISQLTSEAIARLISPATFNERKAEQIRALAQRVLDEQGGELPCDREVLLSFDGVGPKCANLALGIACGEQLISVDIHVHRVTNRWGYIHASTPEKTLAALEAKLPREYWVEINRLLVPFGKHICTGSSPKCSACPLLDMCQQIGVTTQR